MKKFLLFLLVIFSFTNTVFATEVKDEMYYKRQMLNLDLSAIGWRLW